MKISKLVRRIRVYFATKIYDITSKHDVLECSKLYDTPDMTRYHHIVSALRYVYIEHHYGLNDFGKEMYIKANHWESDVAKEEDLNKFNALICSVEKRGYDSKSSIYVDLDNNCINGTHRLALCAWFKIDTIPVVVIRRRFKLKTMQQMKEYYNLSDGDYSKLNLAYKRMRESFL